MSDYRFAIIGCGRIATRHAEEISKGGKLGALCDIVPGKAETLASQYRATAYTCVSELLKNETQLQVVSVCTPNYLHAQHSIQSLRAGFNVLCEKPLAI